MRAWRGPFGVTMRQCLREASLPAVLATVAAALCHWLDDPTLAEDTNSAAAATPWLTLPLFVAAVGCCYVAARTWPTFSRRRGGADTVRRVVRGPLGGRGAVALGATAAQLVICLPIALALSAWVGVPPIAKRHHRAACDGSKILDRAGASLRFDLSSPVHADAIQLRPRASLPMGPRSTRVEVTSEGSPLTTEPVEVEASLELIRLKIAARELTELTLTQVDGDIPLIFQPGSVVIVGTDESPRWGNAALLALFSCGTSILALTLGALLGLGAGWPTVASSIGVAQFIQWISGVGPIDEAILALARGQWLL